MKEPQNWWQKFGQRIKQGCQKIASQFKQTFAPADQPTDWRFRVNVAIQTVRKLVIYLFTALVIFGGLVLGLGLGYFSGLMSHEDVPNYQSMKRQVENVDQSSTLYFDDRVKLADVKSDLIRTKVSYDQISPYLVKAVIATEDADFYKHRGIVPKSLIRAVLTDVTGIGTQTGGSTLTQQLVKLQLLSSETTWRRKAIEMMLALRISKYFSKEQILESYLNVVTLGRNSAGQNIAGVETAAEGIFNKKAKDLSLPEAAFIAGLPQSPSIYTPFNADGSVKKDLTYSMKRKNVVLFRMYRHGDISKADYEAAKKVDLKTKFAAPTEAKTKSTKYGYMYNLVMSQARDILIEQLVEQNGRSFAKVKKDNALYNKYWEKADTLLKEKGYQVESTVQKDLYDQLQDITAEASQNFGRSYTETAFDNNLNKNVTLTEKVQTGSVVLDNKTGAVIAFVGGRDFDENQTNHAFDTLRSPGSSIKPLIAYGPAVENNVISSKSMMADFLHDFGNYKPTDYGNRIQNRFIAADEALAWSYNLPAVNLYQHLRDNTSVNVKSYLRKMGINFTDSEYAQLGIALGGLDQGISVEQNASAFATFANGGKHVEPYVVSKITAPNGKVIYTHKKKETSVFSKATSYIMQQMLKEVVTRGTGSQLNWSSSFNTNNLYGKTGTSNDNRDIWFVGSTPGITMATWMGYDNYYGNTHNLTDSSSSINMSYWSKMANALYQRNPKLMKLSQAMSKPDGVLAHSVLAATGTNAGVVSHNGTNINLTGAKTTALFNNGQPNGASYKFGIGGTDDNYKLFWDHYQGKDNGYGTVLNIDSNGNVLNPPKTEKEKEKEQKEKEKEDKDNKEATTNKDTNNSSGERTDAANNSSGSANTTGSNNNTSSSSSSSSSSQSSSQSSSSSSSSTAPSAAQSH